MRATRLALLGLLAGCWPRNPGPRALDLANGPVALVQEEAPAPRVALTVTVRAGSAHDPPGQEGLAWLTAWAMARGGAGTRSAADLEQALYGLGTELELELGPELVQFVLRCAPEDLAACGELLGEILVAPTLDEAALVRARAMAQAELDELALGPPEALAAVAFDRWTWQGHPYGHAIAGRTGALPAIRALDLQRFHRERYLRPAVRLGVAGPPAPAAVDALQRSLARLPPLLYRDVTPRLLPAASGRDLVVLTVPVDPTCVVLGHATELSPAHPDRLAVEAGLAILGEGPRSRLHRALRLGPGAEGEVEAGLGDPDDLVQPAFRIGLRADGAEAVLPMLAVTLGELERLLSQGPEPDELVLWKQVFARREDRRASSPVQRVLLGSRQQLLGGPGPEARLAAASALDPQSISAALRRHLHPQDLRIVVVTRDDAALRALRPEGSAAPVVQPAETPIAPSPDYGIGIDAVSFIHAQELLR